MTEPLELSGFTADGMLANPDSQTDRWCLLPMHSWFCWKTRRMLRQGSAWTKIPQRFQLPLRSSWGSRRMNGGFFSRIIPDTRNLRFIRRPALTRVFP